jgi:membrane-bound lytic murein transglycosylase D
MILKGLLTMKNLLKQAILTLILMIPTYSSFAEDDSLNQYINTVQEGLKSDINKAENMSSYSYSRGQQEPGKDPKPIKNNNSNHNFNEYFNTISSVKNNNVDFFINYYSSFGKRKLEDSLITLTRYFPVIKKYAQVYNLPLEVAILGIVESNFRINAISADGGRGLWNLSKSNAHIYNLTQNDYLDERMDVDKATNVAFKYIAGLKEAYHGNWPMIIAAYNGGGAYLNQKMRDFGTTDFWNIISKDKNFNNASVEFVVRFYALLEVVKNASNYSISVPEISNEMAHFEVLKLSKSGVSFKDIANTTNIPLSELVAMNPQLVKHFTLEDANFYIPARTAKLVASRISSSRVVRLKWIPTGDNLSLGAYKVAYNKPARRKSKVIFYSIKRHDTLYSIAKNYHMKAHDIAKFNKMKLNSILKVGKVIKVALKTSVSSSKAKKRGHSQRSIAYRTKKVKAKKIYSVKKGDTLFAIAKHYNVALNKIKAKNPNRIKPGDKIIIE